MQVQVDVEMLRQVAEYIATTQPALNKQADLQKQLSDLQTNLQKEATSRKQMLESVADLLVTNQLVAVSKRAMLIEKMASGNNIVRDVLSKAIQLGSVAPDTLGTGITPETKVASGNNMPDEFDTFVNN